MSRPQWNFQLLSDNVAKWIEIFRLLSVLSSHFDTITSSYSFLFSELILLISLGDAACTQVMLPFKSLIHSWWCHKINRNRLCERIWDDFWCCYREYWEIVFKKKRKCFKQHSMCMIWMSFSGNSIVCDDWFSVLWIWIVWYEMFCMSSGLVQWVGTSLWWFVCVWMLWEFRDLERVILKVGNEILLIIWAH